MRHLMKIHAFASMILLSQGLFAGPVPLQKVNEYILKTHKSLELQRARVILDNKLSATPPEAATTFNERDVNSTYGVEMKMMDPMPDIQESGSYIPTSSDSLIEQRLLDRQNERILENQPVSR